MNKCTPPTLVLYAQNGCNDFVFNIPFSLFQATYQGQKLFDFAVCSDNGKAILSEFGAKIAVTGDLSLLDMADIIVIIVIIVISGFVGDVPNAKLCQKLQIAHAQGKKSSGCVMALLCLLLLIFCRAKRW
ncbi:Uncharacterised protein [Moraxella bovis]|uniref:Uncharacterized protein n=2 Tax=Moraxella bovis TaxID=476 RepID=A0A378PTZ8_MORBO|nr:Uncharacterised protein [Moraxella bovis]